jgi:hypothetical protein
MVELGRVLTEADLNYLVRIAAPGAKDRASLVRALREDSDILLGMLSDASVLKHLLAEPERVLTASPRLYFATLLVRIRSELEHTTYTIEQENRHLMLVFDSREVAGLMHRPDVLAYLVGMLASFIKIRTQSILVRLRKGMWRRMDYSDMDLGNLITWGERAGPEELFPLERRIGDVCLFQSSFFPTAPAPKGARAAELLWTRERLAEIGRHYYRTASRRSEARDLAVAETLEELAERFDIAVKPLALMSSRYLDRLKTRIFAG